MDYSFHQDWKKLRFAYTSSSGESLTTKHFDVAELSKNDIPFYRPISSEVKHLINESHDSNAWVNPRHSTQAVLFVGIPYSSGVLLCAPVLLLALTAAFLISNYLPKFGNNVTSLGRLNTLWVVFFSFLALSGLGISHFWLSVFASFPPWWLIPSFALLCSALLLWPKEFQKSIVRDLLIIFIPLIPISGIVGMLLADSESFEMQLTEEEYTERLSSPHPAVTNDAREKLKR